MERTWPGEGAPGPRRLLRSETVSSTALWEWVPFLSQTCGGLTEVIRVKSRRLCAPSRSGQVRLTGFSPVCTVHPPLTWSPRCPTEHTLSPGTVSGWPLTSYPVH